MRKFQKGFSLVELLVVIAIIAIVASIAVSSVTVIQRSGRDTQRITDLRTIQLALQQYYANENHYPDSLTLTGGAALTNCTGLTGCTIVRTYSKQTPMDPTTGTTTPYCYVSLVSSQASAANCVAGTSNSGTCAYYELYANQEAPESGAGSYSCNNQTYNYRVNPL